MSTGKPTLDERTKLGSTSANYIVIDPVVERRIVRKLDLTVVPILSFLFLVSFIDRGNIGNAKIQGMTESLHMKGTDYNQAVWLFVVAFIICGLPSNLIYRWAGPKTLSVMMLLWGICSTCQGLVETPAGLKAMRFLMGMFEAGFIPSCAHLIGSYYSRDEFLKRYAVFFSSSVIAGAFNGLLATLFAKMDGVGNYEGWRWIFLMEGFITVLTSIASFWLIVPFPENNHSFIPEEKAVVLQRIAIDRGSEEEQKWWNAALEAVADPKVWLATLCYFGAEENSSSIIYFQPTILKGLGYTSTEAQVKSIPIYAVAFVVCLISAYASERLRQRYLFVVLGLCLVTTGLAIELAQPKAAGVRYAGLYFMVSGCYIIMPTTVVWLAINMGKGYKRTVAIGILIPLGNTGALVSSNVFLTNQAPTYHTGFATGLGVCMLSLASAIGLFVMLLMLRWGEKRTGCTSPEDGDTQARTEKVARTQYSL